MQKYSLYANINSTNMYLNKESANKCSISRDYSMVFEADMNGSMLHRHTSEFDGPSVIPLNKSDPYVKVNRVTPHRQICNGYSSCAVSYLKHNKTKQYHTPDELYIYHTNNQNGFNFKNRNYGQISYTTKSSRDTLKTIKKRKRKRTMFTTEQIIALEEVFHKKPYINREERIAITNRLQVSEKSIKVWFQNRRRMTDKKNKEEDLLDTRLDRLTIIEAQINENTDEYGYVTLDNRTMNELVSVIDEYLSLDCNYGEETTSPIASNIIMYEPISPVSSTDNSEDIDQTEDFDHQEMSQQLTDIEALLFS